MKIAAITDRVRPWTRDAAAHASDDMTTLSDSHRPSPLLATFISALLGLQREDTIPVIRRRIFPECANAIAIQFQ
jgi:hypothetical protein